MALTLRGLDLSFSRADETWWKRRYAEGYRVMSQALWTGAMSPSAVYANLRDAKAAGFAVTGYTNVTATSSDAIAVARAMQAAGDLWPELYQVQVDVEIEGVQESYVRGACETLRAEGKRPAIYSARWFWVGKLGNPQWPWLKEYPIWNAYYDGDPDVDFASAPWGPWTVDDVIAEQYQGTTDIEGVQVDLDVFSEQFYTQEEEIMAITEEWLQKRFDDLAAQLRGAIVSIAAGIENTALLGKSPGQTVAGDPTFPRDLPSLQSVQSAVTAAIAQSIPAASELSDSGSELTLEDIRSVLSEEFDAAIARAGVRLAGTGGTDGT